MSGDSESNRRARDNGVIGEETAEELLRQIYTIKAVERVNELIDFVVQGTWVEVKSCQKAIVDRSVRSGWRKGRFVLDINQHNALQNKDGYYFFIVLEDGTLYRSRMVKASQVKYTNNLTWNKVVLEKEVVDEAEI